MASYFASLPLNFNQLPTDTSDGALAGTPFNMLDSNQSTFWSLDAETGGVRFKLGDSSIEFDAYYMVSQNVGEYTASGLTTQTAPLSVSRAAAAAGVKQYVFHEIATQTGTTADFNWTSRVDAGSPVRIYEFYVMKLLYSVSEADGYRQIDQSQDFRGIHIKESLDGDRTLTRPLGNKGRWQVNYGLNILSDQDAKVIRLNEFFAMHPNFTHVVNYPTHPDRVYLASLRGGIGYRYNTAYTGSGSNAGFTIEER